MSRYIDAEWLEKLFPDTGEGEWTYNATALGYIDSAPSIDIVRCGECKWAEKTKFTNFEGDFVYRKTCPVHKGFIDAGGFCSYGERKGNEAD